MIGQIKRLFNSKPNPPQRGHFIPNKNKTTVQVSPTNRESGKLKRATILRKNLSPAEKKAAKTRGGKRRKTKKNARTKKRVSMKKRRSKRNRH